MKKINLTIILALVLFACKDQTKSDINLEENRAKSYDQNDGLITLKGDFVYYKDAAVFQTSKEIYGVVIDENLQLLEKQVKPFKKEATDMVPVTIRVKRTETNDPNTWKYRVEIKEILKVEAPDPNKEDVIKLGN